MIENNKAKVYDVCNVEYGPVSSSENNKNNFMNKKKLFAICKR